MDVLKYLLEAFGCMLGSIHVKYYQDDVTCAKPRLHSLFPDGSSAYEYEAYSFNYAQWTMLNLRSSFEARL